MRLLLDAGVLLALRRSDASVQRALQTRKDAADDVGVSRFTQYELPLGASYLWREHNDAREFAMLGDIFSWLTVYEIDGDVVREAAELQADALNEGEPLPDMDLVVARSEVRVRALDT